jgi:hypothetical protein
MGEAKIPSFMGKRYSNPILSRRILLKMQLACWTSSRRLPTARAMLVTAMAMDWPVSR